MYNILNNVQWTLFIIGTHSFKSWGRKGWRSRKIRSTVTKLYIRTMHIYIYTCTWRVLKKTYGDIFCIRYTKNILFTCNHNWSICMNLYWSKYTVQASTEKIYQWASDPTCRGRQLPRPIQLVSDQPRTACTCMSSCEVPLYQSTPEIFLPEHLKKVESLLAVNLNIEFATIIYYQINSRPFFHFLVKIFLNLSLCKNC